MISINNEIKSTFILLETDLTKTDQVILKHERDLIYTVVIEKYTKQYINRQRRINSIKSPFKRARNILQEILGENMEKIQIEEVVDLLPLETEKKVTKDITSKLSYSECFTYLSDTKKHGLKNTNKFWKEKMKNIVES